MGSPFPGMDPYLEGDMWQEFHGRLASAISAQLMPRLAPNYVALLARRYSVTHHYVLDGPLVLGTRPAERAIYPDVSVTRIEETQAAYEFATPDDEIDGGDGEQVPQLAVEIRDVAERRLVTVIEILSPANKYEPGYGEYLQKRAELLQTDAHLLELDLLRRGSRVTLSRPLPPSPYYAILNRGTRRVNEIFTLPLQGRLKVLPVPLLAPDKDVPLDLQAAVDACFALVGYERLLPYRQPPPPPELPPEELAWVEERLREAGLRER
jgi:hypothetical protein